MGDAIRKCFGDGEKLGLKISYVEQKEVRGTGDAAAVAEPYVDGDFVLVYGDLLFGIDAVKERFEVVQARGNIRGRGRRSRRQARKLRHN